VQSGDLAYRNTGDADLVTPVRNEESAKTAWYPRTSVPPRDPDSTKPKKAAVIAATTKNAASRIAGPVIFIDHLPAEAADRIGGRQGNLTRDCTLFVAGIDCGARIEVDEWRDLADTLGRP